VGTYLEPSPSSVRRDFRLPSEDERFLDSSGWRWEAVLEEAIRRVILYGYTLPSGYNQVAVDLYLRIERGYPDVQLDMAYVYPPLEKMDGGRIKAVSPETFDGRIWQRWSRHRTAENPWRPGLDNLETHLALVAEWIAREVRG
jgi:hypothetical protein